MTLTIGHTSFDCGPDSDSIDDDGTVLSFTIDIDPGTLAAAKVMRQQMLGLVSEPERKAWPVTWSDDSTIDGWYYPRSVTVSPVANYLANGLMTVSVSLERVAGGFSVPTFEMRAKPVIRTNSLSLATNVVDVLWGIPPASWKSLTVPSASGTTVFGGDEMEIRYGAIGGNTEETMQFIPASVSEALVGAATIEMLVPGGTASDEDDWAIVVGKQIPAHDQVRIQNGVIRLWVEADGTLDVQRTLDDGSAWGTKYTATLQGIQDDASVEPITLSIDRMRILRNDEDLVSVRVPLTFQYQWIGWGESHGTIDITLRRGMSIAEIQCNSDDDVGDKTLVPSAQSQVGATWGRSSEPSSGADGNNHRWVFANDSTGTPSGTTAEVTSGTQAFGWGVGDDTLATYSHNVEGAVRTYFVAMPTEQDVVAL